MSRASKVRRLGWASAIAGVAMLSVAACGNSDMGNQASAAAGDSSSGLATAEANVKALYGGDTFKQPPATAPRPQPGKKIWVISPGQGSYGGAVWTAEAKEAGKVMGWDVTVYDGQFQTAKWLEGVQQAAAAHADGIILFTEDCPTIKAGLQQAKAAGIKVVGASAADCSDYDPSQPALMDGAVEYSMGGMKEYSEALGKAQADAVTVHTQGKGKIINITYDESLQNKWQNGGFTGELKAVCPGCSIVQTVNIVSADLVGTALRQKIEQALLRHPDATALVAPFDDVMTTSGGAAAVKSSGRSGQIYAISTVGYPDAITSIREDTGLDATVGTAVAWDSWALMDNLNRLFNGQPIVNSGSGIQLVERGHGDGSTSGFVPPVDFRAAYTKAWAGE
ncbi:substrate-binding domain-containing protein [Nocardia sp. R6R-6]|uniref:substrate-binding domain-containing protein n=1 Tax=Nocardia sp. R6R-6 TaxID=3459303 RepID=UPI00403E0900